MNCGNGGGGGRKDLWWWKMKLLRMRENTIVDLEGKNCPQEKFYCSLERITDISFVLEQWLSRVRTKAFVYCPLLIPYENSFLQ